MDSNDTHLPMMDFVIIWHGEADTDGAPSVSLVTAESEKDAVRKAVASIDGLDYSAPLYCGPGINITNPHQGDAGSYLTEYRLKPIVPTVTEWETETIAIIAESIR